MARIVGNPETAKLAVKFIQPILDRPKSVED